MPTGTQHNDVIFSPVEKKEEQGQKTVWSGIFFIYKRMGNYWALLFKKSQYLVVLFSVSLTVAALRDVDREIVTPGA